MKIPFQYQVRSLAVRRRATAMTVAGVALSVAVLVGVLSLQEGLRSVCRTSGDPLNVLVLRKGADSELLSSLSRGVFADLQQFPGIARGAAGEPLASLELVTVINLPARGRPEGSNVLVRGIDAAGRGVRGALRLTAGRWFDVGRREAVVGKSLASHHSWSALGGALPLAARTWTVVGVADTGSPAGNSEILVERGALENELRRADTPSSVLLRAASREALPGLIRRLEDDRRLNVSPVSERQYYAAQTRSGLPVQMLGTLVAVIMAVGSCFAVMNTMYASVANRAREIGILRVLGFSRASVLSSFLLESLMLAAAGSLAGCLLALPLNSLHTSMGSFTTYGDILFSFRVSAQPLAHGLVFGLVIGSLGGYLPARRASRGSGWGAIRN